MIPVIRNKGRTITEETDFAWPLFHRFPGENPHCLPASKAIH